MYSEKRSIEKRVSVKRNSEKRNTDERNLSLAIKLVDFLKYFLNNLTENVYLDSTGTLFHSLISLNKNEHIRFLNLQGSRTI